MHAKPFTVNEILSKKPMRIKTKRSVEIDNDVKDKNVPKMNDVNTKN